MDYTAAVNVRFHRVFVSVGKSAEKSQGKSKQGYFPVAIPRPTLLAPYGLGK